MQSITTNLLMIHQFIHKKILIPIKLQEKIIHKISWKFFFISLINK